MNKLLQQNLPKMPFTQGGNGPRGTPCFLLAGCLYLGFFLFTKPTKTSGDMVGNGPSRPPLLFGNF
jgi:hypothetical protein